jgi:hypothetical protein
MAKPGYRYGYQQARAALLAGGPTCFWCGKRPATQADHDPPLVTVANPDHWVGVLRPSCEVCAGRQAASLSGWTKRRAVGHPLPSRPW